MTIEELLNELEGSGLSIDDWNTIIETLSLLGYAPFDRIYTTEELEEVNEI